MAGNNAIGTGAVVLTANADKLSAGLDKAARDIHKFAAKADKLGGGKGIMGAAILGGGVGGAVAGGIGLIGAAAGKAVDFVYDLLTSLEERASKVQLNPDVKKGVERVDTTVRQLSNTWDTLLLTAVAKLAPMFERITPAIEATMFIAEGLFEAVVDVIGEVLEQIGRWIDSTTDLGVMTNDSGSVMFKVFQAVGKAVAYVWDTIKAGAGVVAYIAGTIVEAFGTVVKTIGEAVDMLAKLAAELPDAIRPTWVQGAADAVKSWGDGIAGAGDQMARWGKKALLGWGQSAVQVAAWVDQIQGRFEKRQKVAASAFGDKDPLKMVGAMDRGSKEAYSIVARNQVNNSQLNPNNPDRIQADLLRQVRDEMRKVVEQLRGSDIIKVLG